jgi:hypothetical protein
MSTNETIESKLMISRVPYSLNHLTQYPLIQDRNKRSFKYNPNLHEVSQL